MSVIETPPEDRLPIQTRVAEASAGLVRDAILRELDRGGQVFFVHNRVETIEAQTEQLRRMLPGARFVVGHGQMPEGHLESVMITFAGGEADVLVCTTIIESGPRHPEREHDRHRPGRHARARPALPAPRPRRAEQPPRVRLPALPPPRADERGGAEAAPGDLQRVGAGCRLPDRARRPRDPRRRQHPRRRAVRATWPPSGSTSTRGCWPRRSRSGRRGARIGRPRVEKPQAVVDLPVEAHLPDDYVPEEAQKLELYRRLARARDGGRPRRVPPGADRPVRPDAGAGRPARRGRRAAADGRGGRRGLDVARGRASSSSASARGCRGRRRCGCLPAAGCRASSRPT